MRQLPAESGPRSVQVGARAWTKRRLNRTATLMSHDHDQLRAQVIHCVLDAA